MYHKACQLYSIGFFFYIELSLFCFWLYSKSKSDERLLYEIKHDLYHSQCTFFLMFIFIQISRYGTSLIQEFA
jgi:hypothetical protein